MEVFVQQLINGITLGSIYALVAIGYTMVYGIIGMINFAHGDIFMVGSFLALIAFLALLAIGYLVFSANSGPSTPAGTSVDVNNTPAVTAPADTGTTPASMTEAPATGTETTPMAPAPDAAAPADAAPAAPATTEPAPAAPAADAPAATEPAPATP